jgi:hypothetical protein
MTSEARSAAGVPGAARDAVYPCVEGLPGANFWNRIWSRSERRAGQRDFVLRAMPRNAVCGEVGVFAGDFSLRILAIAQPVRLHLIDPWIVHSKSATHERVAEGHAAAGADAPNIQYEMVRTAVAPALAAGVAVMHRGFSFVAAAQFPDAYFDWVYIDASHDYEDVKRDLHGFLPKVKPGGWIAGDDYGRRGAWNNGVQVAVDEFAARGHALLVKVRRHQFLLRKP